MYNLQLMREEIVSIDNWNSTRTEYYTTYEYVHNPYSLLTGLTNAIVVAAEQWPMCLEDFAAVMLTGVYDQCEYVERPFSMSDAEDLWDWVPEYIEKASGLTADEAEKLAFKMVDETLCDFFSEQDIDRFY